MNRNLTIGDIRETALGLWHAGWRGDKHARPLDPTKPLIPSVIAQKLDLPLWAGAKVNHLLIVWSKGLVSVGEYDKL